MNELQNKELALLKCFVDVCERLGLTYYLLCGTALGAVKYKGFIPWDDDVDVGLFREEYERFLKEAPALLPEGIFLQTYKTDPAYPQIFGKLRDSNTTYIEKASAKLPMNHGIYIDIFPLDGYPSDPAEQKRLERLKIHYKRQIACCYDVKRSVPGRVLCGFNRLIGCHKRTGKILARYEELIRAYPTEGSAVICNHGNWQGRLEYADRSQYGEGTWAEFEGLQVRIPEQYDAYLTQKYKDWRADLPPEEQVGHHYYSVMDTQTPYTEYLR